MEKSPDAFRTISEVAEDLDLPQHVLRFWETRFSQIKPLKRGGGRRYYRPDDVQLLRGIKHLLYGEGYTIKGVQRILREQGLRHVMGLWRDEISEPGADTSETGPEAYAPKTGRAGRGLEPVFEPGDPGPTAYARSSAALVTARRPNFEIVGSSDQEEDDDDEIEIVEDEVETDAEEPDLGEDAEEEERDEENDDDEEDDEEEEGEGAHGLSAEGRERLEQVLRELTELRHVLDAAG